MRKEALINCLRLGIPASLFLCVVVFILARYVFGFTDVVSSVSAAGEGSAVKISWTHTPIPAWYKYLVRIEEKRSLAHCYYSKRLVLEVIVDGKLTKTIDNWCALFGKLPMKVTVRAYRKTDNVAGPWSVPKVYQKNCV